MKQWMAGAVHPPSGELIGQEKSVYGGPLYPDSTGKTLPKSAR